MKFHLIIKDHFVLALVDLFARLQPRESGVISFMPLFRQLSASVPTGSDTGLEKYTYKKKCTGKALQKLFHCIKTNGFNYFK